MRNPMNLVSRYSMNRWLLMTFAAAIISACHHAPVQAQSSGNSERCLEVSLTGTQGGPPQVGSLAGPGTLVRFGTKENNCSDIILQFDSGRNTVGRLSELGVSVKNLDAVFYTHMHSDHTEGLSSLLLLRWHFFGGPLDIVCSADSAVPQQPVPRTMSCESFVAHIADAFIASGEIAQRYAESNKRHPDGPSHLANLKTVDLPLPDRPGHVVWEKGDVLVTAVASRHIPGHLSFRVDSPAGSVVIGGDAGNNVPTPPRDFSTSAAVERLSKDADILVHSVIHPVFRPGNGSAFPAVPYYRQSAAGDLGAMAKRAGVKQLMLTHLIPSLDTTHHGPFEIPGGPLSAVDFDTAVRSSGFDGEVHVGTDMLTIRLLEFQK